VPHPPAKIDNIAETIPLLKTFGDETGELLYSAGAARMGPLPQPSSAAGPRLDVSSAHLRYLDPMPKNTGDVLRSFKRVLIPEMNLGQLAAHIRAKFVIDAMP